MQLVQRRGCENQGGRERNPLERMALNLAWNSPRRSPAGDIST